MIKGVNKKIVEINYTKNDYIEKAILIINPNKSNSPDFIINKKADDYMKTLLPESTQKKKKKKKSNMSILVFVSLLVVLFILISLIVIALI